MKLKFYIVSALLVVSARSVLMQAQNYNFQNRDLPIEQRLDDLIDQMTLDEKITVLTSGFNYHGVPRLGIKDVQTADGPLGVASWGIRGKATAFPAALSLAASWDRDLAKEVGAAYAREWRARGLDVLYGPGVNLSRSAKSSRNFEYFGEDPYLTSEMAVPFIQAVQDGGVLAVVKHYAANDQEFDRYLTSTEVDERTLRELYLAPFEAAVKRGGVLALMTGYNLVNGTYCANHHWLLTEILRNEWGFNGTVMSDWGATHADKESVDAGLDMELGTADFLTAAKLKPLLESGELTQAQIDAMVKNIFRPLMQLGIFDRIAEPDKGLLLFSSENNNIAYKEASQGIVLLKNDRNLLPLSGDVRKIAVIGPNALNYSNGRAAYGGGGSSKVDPWYITSDLPEIARAFPNAEVTYSEGISNGYAKHLFERTGVVNFRDETIYTDTVDLKDDSYKRTEPRVWTHTITADHDDTINFLVKAQGGWRLSVNGNVIEDRIDMPSISDGVVSLPVKSGEELTVKIEYRDNRCNPRELRYGWDYESNLAFADAVNIAKDADVVIFAAGFDSDEEYEGTDRTFDLPFGQAQLISAIAEVNPNVVVTLRGGGGMATEQWIDRVPALLHLIYPGQEGARALADILAGAVNPSAKLPFTMERRWADSPAYPNYDQRRADRVICYDEGVFMGYRGYDKSGIEPLFPFGHGLSYSNFEYGNLEVTPVTDQKQSFEVTFDITNTSDRAGAEVAQLYVGDVKSSEPRPLKELKNFAKVTLNPGETKTVRLTLDSKDFRFFSSKKGKWVVEPGEFMIYVGSSSKNLPLTTMIKLK